MKRRELINLGIHEHAAIATAIDACRAASDSGQSAAQIRATLRELVPTPARFIEDPIFGALARLLDPASRRAAGQTALPTTPPPRAAPLPYLHWGDDIDVGAHDQMRNACRLPVTVSAALMPDAHIGYGLPIGGVLATENAVIPYAVGVDIACRVKVTVFDIPPARLFSHASEFERALERETRFGVGATWGRDRADHAVMDEDWNVTALTRTLRETAWNQLGTSGSGNHFVEFGEIEFGPNNVGVPPGQYVGCVSHSGSRGSGAKVCAYYSDVARKLHPSLPKELSYLAWLPLDGVGAEYWAAMELMGKYASANHDVIHRKIIAALGADVRYQVENHHNFAWKEQHDGRELIVHRKGATPAGSGVIGYIPGTMASPGYLVEGLGDARSLNSASHGAGRRLSRAKARESTRWNHVRAMLNERGVTLLSAGLDENPTAYKDIDEVMAAQRELVRPFARLMPRIVKMAPDGEQPED